MTRITIRLGVISTPDPAAQHCGDPRVCAAVSALLWAWDHYRRSLPNAASEAFRSPTCEAQCQVGAVWWTIREGLREIARLHPANLSLDDSTEGVV